MVPKLALEQVQAVAVRCSCSVWHQVEGIRHPTQPLPSRFRSLLQQDAHSYRAAEVAAFAWALAAYQDNLPLVEPVAGACIRRDAVEDEDIPFPAS